MSPRWHKLSLQAKNLPSLLFRYTWTHEGYELYLTDLTSIWSEQLHHGNIVQRAEQECTTIDPSEGKDQMELLLTKVGEALDGAGGEPRLNSGSQADSIEINISAKLPAPLKPLKWKMHLSKEPTSSVTNHLLLPLLNDEAAWKSRQQVLLGQIKQKDWILEKLFDRMGALGVDISTVFPSAAGIRSSRKGDMRSEVGKIIKGVAPFDEQAWLAQPDSSSENFNLASNIVHEIFGVSPENCIRSFNPRRDDWWNELKRPSKAASQEEVNPPSKEQDSINSSSERQANRPDADLSVHEEATTDTTDSEFEV